MVRTGLTAEYAWLWNHRTTGAGSTSFDTARALEVGVGRLVALFGGSPLLAQQVFYTGLAMLAACGAAYFARSWTRQRLAVIAAGIIGLLNPFVMVNLPNPLPLLAVGTMGVLGGVVVRSAAGQRLSTARIVLASLPVSYLAVNPPLLAVCAAWVLALALMCRWTVGPGATVQALRVLLRSSPWLVLVNLWWLVPFVQVNLLGTAGIGFAAQTNVSGWAWSHAQNSVANVVTLSAQWGWGRPEYFPYAATLSHWPWVWLRWLLPLVAFAAPAISRTRRKAALLLTGLALVLLFLGKGLHAPLEGINAWLYVHVPGLWLLREPMSKVGPCLVLVYAVLVSMTFAGLTERIGPWRPSVRLSMRSWGSAVVAGGLVALVAYPAPIFDGRVMADHRLPLPPTHVRLPHDWLVAAAVLQQPGRSGKILELPRDPFYQVTTNWGYHGVDDLLQQLVTRPVIQSLPGGYFTDLRGFDALLAATQADLLDGNTGTLAGRLRALGVSTVVVRDDLRPGAGEPAVADAAVLERALDRAPAVARRADVGVAHIYDVVAPTGVVVASSQVVGVVGSTPVAIADGVANVPPGQLAIDASAGVDTLSLDTAASTHAVLLARSSAYRLTNVPTGPMIYRVSVRSTGKGAALDVRDSVSVLIDGVPLAGLGGAFSMPLVDRRVDAVGTPRSVRFVVGDQADVPIATGDLVTAYRAEPSVLNNAPMSAVEDCNALDRRSPDVLGLRADTISGGVRLRAAVHSACVSTPTEAAAPGWYRLAVSYRTSAGAPARVCVWQQGPDRCAELPPLTPSAGWATATVPVAVQAGTTGLRVYLYADGLQNGTTTVTEYRMLSLQHLTAVAEAPLAATSMTVTALTPGQHDIAVVQPLVPPLDPGSGTVQDCANTGPGGSSGLRMRRVPDGNGIELRANADSACVWVPVADVTGTEMVAVHLEARTLAGRPARLCLWEDGPNRCADLTALRLQRGWQAYDAIARTDPGTVAARLYLYADGQKSPETVTRYRAVHAEVVRRSRLVIAPINQVSGPDLVLRYRQENPGRYRVDMGEPPGPFVLALSESYAPGWTLRGLPAGATARHIQVNGYANGWLITSSRPLSVMLEYVPAKVARAALSVSRLAIGLLLIWTVAGALHRRRRRRRFTGTP